ncbi:MAG: class B sortase [Clostridia bacterium]
MMAGCLTVFIVSATLLVRYFSAISSSKQVSAELRDVYHADATNAPAMGENPVNADHRDTAALAAAKDAVHLPQKPLSFEELWPTSYAGNPHMMISKPFLDLMEKSKDIVGWLTIDGVLDEPVVQRDNAYYLTHDYLGRKNDTGSLFLDEGCHLKSVPMQMLIHGHNMKEGAMFGALKKYKVKDASFYQEHPFIQLNTLYEQARYVIFAVDELSINPSKPHYLPFWAYSSFQSEKEFRDYISDLREFSHYRCNVEVQPGDRLLLLATCQGSDEDARLVIAARMLRPNEDEIGLKAAILTTKDR